MKLQVVICYFLFSHLCSTLGNEIEKNEAFRKFIKFESKFELLKVKTRHHFSEREKKRNLFSPTNYFIPLKMLLYCFFPKISVFAPRKMHCANEIAMCIEVFLQLSLTWTSRLVYTIVISNMYSIWVEHNTAISNGFSCIQVHAPRITIKSQSALSATHSMVVSKRS